MVLSELVDSLRQKYGIGVATAEQSARDAWPQIVGPANAGYSHPVRVDERGRLVIQTTHSVVRNELFMNREEILGRIRKLPGCSALKQIHLT